MIEELKPYIYDIVKELSLQGEEKIIKGHKEYNCLCPFHDDHNPSMFINLDEGVYHCFGCGAKGDIIHLYAELNSLNDKEALLELKNRYLGLNTNNKEKEFKNEKSKDMLKKAQYMWDNAQKDPLLIREYLKSRGISANLYTPDLRLYKNNIMLSKVVNSVNEFKTLHMTILDEKDGKIKAKEKKFLKGLKTKGYTVHIGEPIDSLGLAEGIETALSVKEALPGLPVWAAFSATNLENVELSDLLALKNVYIFYDKDNSKTGQKAATSLANRLYDDGYSVYLVEPPFDIPKESKGVDFNDVLVAKGQDAIVEAFKNSELFEPKGEQIKSIEEKVLSLIKDKIELFHTKTEDTFLKIKRKDFTEIRKIRNRTTHNFIVAEHYLATNKILKRNIADNVIDALEALALNEGNKESVFYRIAFKNNNLYLDLADEKWRVVEITQEGWKILDKSPVNFVRYHNTLTLPYPKPGGSIEMFRNLLNLEKKEFYVVVDFFLGILSHLNSYIGLILLGEQGTAKTTAARLIKKTLDPDEKDKLTRPKNEEDLIISASTSKVVIFDNLSKCSQNFSDSLCRLLDGSGLAKRKLFSDAEEVILRSAVPVILTSITNPFVYQDLLDRVVMLTLKPISPKKRKTEDEMFKEFKEIHPYLLGALCDMALAGLKNLHKVNLENKPRRADFATWLAACEYEQKEKRLLPAYLDNINNITVMSILKDPLASTLLSWFEGKEYWEGTVNELKNQILNYADKESKNMITKASNKFSEQLIRLSSFMRKIGMDIQKKRTSKGSYITITPTDTE